MQLVAIMLSLSIPSNIHVVGPTFSGFGPDVMAIGSTILVTSVSTWNENQEQLLIEAGKVSYTVVYSGPLATRPHNVNLRVISESSGYAATDVQGRQNYASYPPSKFAFARTIPGSGPSTPTDRIGFPGPITVKGSNVAPVNISTFNGFGNDSSWVQDGLNWKMTFQFDTETMTVWTRTNGLDKCYSEAQAQQIHSVEGVYCW